MPFLPVGKENSHDINLYYEDQGSGKPVVLVHGWPLNGASWERQTAALLSAGYRVIAYDRRGFGRSDKPGAGYDYDTLASDLAAVIRTLGLKDVTLVGFSMGGGELARYMSKFDDGSVTKIAFISCITPYLRKSGENPEGVDPTVFETMKENIVKDRFAFLSTFFKQFYNKSLLSDTHVSDEVLAHSANVAAQSSYTAMLWCIDSWLEDFRADLQTIRIPALVLHGDKDATLPIAATGDRMKNFLPQADYYTVEGGPHNVLWTHATFVNQRLLEFLAAK